MVFVDRGELVDMLEDRFFRPLLEAFFFVAGTLGSSVIDWSFFCGEEDADERDTWDEMDGAVEDEDERNCITPLAG